MIVVLIKTILNNNFAHLQNVKFGSETISSLNVFYLLVYTLIYLLKTSFEKSLPFIITLGMYIYYWIYFHQILNSVLLQATSFQCSNIVKYGKKQELK
jgi:hypothetical protein